MTTEQNTAVLSGLLKDYKEVRATFVKDAQAAFKKSVKHLFEELPGLKTIRWVQYTPYFNDGEPCEFRVNEPTFTNVDASRLSEHGEIDEDSEDNDNEDDKSEDNAEKTAEEDWSFNDGYMLDWSKDYKTTKKVSALPKHLHGKEKLVEDFVKAFNASEMEDVLHEMFGDHVYVTVTKNKIETDEYSHD